jgi:pyruvate dehydrogenase E2 component (dihydrolipoamide acetyltransferase)
MAKIVGLPKLSPTMDEGVLARWNVKVGDVVAVDDLVAEVETDKATMEFRSFDQGTVLALLVDEGASLAPDTPVLILGAPGEDVSALVASARGRGTTAASTAHASGPHAVASGPVVAVPGVPGAAGAAGAGVSGAAGAAGAGVSGAAGAAGAGVSGAAGAAGAGVSGAAGAAGAGVSGAAGAAGAGVSGAAGAAGAGVSGAVRTGAMGSGGATSDVPAPGAAWSGPTGTRTPGSMEPGLAGPGAVSPRGSGERVLASPLVRRLAREHDLDLSVIDGSGPHGRIVKRDIDAALASGPSMRVAQRAVMARGLAGGLAASAPSGSGAFVTATARELRVEKLSPMRRTIARRLTESKQTVPHFYLTVDLDAAPLLEARAQINATLERDGEKVSLNDLLIKACAVALRRVPECNATFAGDAIHYHGRIDISVAVAIADGLVTPVVRDADLKGVLQIAREVRDLAARARERKLRPEEMSDGTFSISNLGMFDIEQFAAVINPPEGAILAVGAVRDEPVVRDGQIVPGKRLKVTLSCDHRVIDGAVGARWLQALRHAVERPVTMLV